MILEQANIGSLTPWQLGGPAHPSAPRGPVILVQVRRRAYTKILVKGQTED